MRITKEERATAISNIATGLFDRYVPDHYFADYDIMLAAVKHDGMLIKNAAQDIQQNKQIAIEALKNNPLAIRHLHESLINDRSFLLNAAKESPMILATNYGPLEHLKNDSMIVLEAVKSDSDAIYFASERIQKLCHPCVCKHDIIVALSNNIMTGQSNLLKCQIQVSMPTPTPKQPINNKI